ncbi:MAG: hypothetical protein IPJ88_10585 [Myxococcales bacterium]|nr:MAG: hypothetical protein IPJ88_10585 [Myxococcales bacterium]
MTRLLSLSGLALWITVLMSCAEDKQISHGNNLPEGGEVRFERMVFPDGTYEYGNIIMQMTSFFIGDYTGVKPERIGVGDCYAIRRDQMWPQFLPDGVQYLDPGDTMTLTGGGQTDQIDSSTDIVDGMYSNHDRGFFWQNFADYPVNTTYNVTIPGSAEFAAKDWDLFLPGDFTTDPVIPGLFEVDPASDFTMTWEVLDTTDEPSVGAFLLFFEENVGNHVICSMPYDQGSKTVPKEYIDLIPDTGAFLFGLFQHTFETVEGRNVDLIAANCKVGFYQKSATQ